MSSSPTSAAASATSADASSVTSVPSGSASGSAGSSSSQGPQTYTVKAGMGGFNFNPDTLENVNVGDTVAFEFYPPDHSVARADFESPCVPYEYTAPDRVGFWSDTQWVGSVNDLSTWRLKINSTEPIFYYCAATGSCIDKGMIGVINPNSSQTLAEHKAAAAKASYQLKPGDEIPSEASSTLSGAPASTASPSSAPTDSGHGHGISGGAIAGIVVGAVAFLVICAALFFYVGRTKSLKEMMQRRDGADAKGAPQPPPETSQQYNNGPISPGYQPSSAPYSPPMAPYSPTPQHAEYGGQLPAYGQHNATDQYPSGWSSPAMQHMSISPQPSPQPQMADVKYNPQESVHEMASPPPNQQRFTAELEAPAKAPK